ncbi:MAG: phosphoethanolamine transferase domain-containing protein, partial [Mixta calida]|nr:phosphoethanolamine transferase domain-containing protein [Mixta calida]
MNYIKTITQQKLSLLLALYIGILLNLPIFYRRFDGFLTKSTPTNWLTAFTEVMAIVVLTFFLMRLLSLGGKRLYRVLATLLVLISVAAAYYMAFFNVVIGYGIVASVMTTDVDLSKEVVGLHFVLWMVGVSALPLLMIWRNNLSQTLMEQLRTPGQRLKPALLMVLCVALVWLPIRYFDKLQKANEEITNIDLPSYGGVVAHSYLPSNWLAAVGLFAWTRIDETLDSQELLDPAKKFTYVAPPGIDDTYVVFVIGETTRWDHMGM